MCRVCKQPRPANRTADAGATRRAGPGTRPGAAAAAVAISPGKRAEELKQAARQAVRAGATAESVQPIIEQERQFRVLQAAAKNLKPLDLAREAVEKAAAAVTTAEAAIAACEAATVVARQKAADARGRHRDRIADLGRIEAARAEEASTNHSATTAHNLLAKAQCFMASLEGLMAMNAGSIPDTVRKEAEDLKTAMALQAKSAAAARVMPAPAVTDTGFRSVLDNTKKLMVMMENCKRESNNQSGGLPECLVECMTAVNQSILVVDPVKTPLLGEALDGAGPDAEKFPLDPERRGDTVDEEMDFSEEGMCATASAIVEELASVTVPRDSHFATVMGHLRSVAAKGIGKGKAGPVRDSPYAA